MENPKWSLLLTYAGLFFLNLVTSIDTTALSTAVPTIAVDLHASSIQAYWTGTAFLLASSVFQPVFAASAAAFGRKAVALASLLIFLAGTLVCATAQGIAALIAGRAVQGVGSGGMMVITYVVIGDMMVLRDRSRGLAMVSLVWLVGAGIGPLMGGGFTEHVTWRWIFWFVLPFLGMSLVLIALFLKTPYKEQHPLQALKEFDWIGSAILVGSLTSFLIAVSWGGNTFAWNSYHTIVPLTLGAAGLVGWLFYEYLVPSNPMIPILIFKNRTAAMAYINTTLMGVIQFGMLYFLPLYYQVAKQYSPLVSGAALIPTCLVTGITTGIMGILIKKSGKYRLVVWIGWILLSLGCGLLVLLDTRTSVAAWFFISLPSGAGLGCLFASLNMAVQAPQQEENTTTASALTPFFRATGQALGISISQAIYQNVLRNKLQTAGVAVLREQAGAISGDAASLVLILRRFPHGTAARHALLTAFNQSLHLVWWTLLGVSLFAGVLSLMTRELGLGNKAGPNGNGEDAERNAGGEMLNLDEAGEGREDNL